MQKKLIYNEIWGDFMAIKILYCPKCKEKLNFNVDESLFINKKRFPVPCVIQHKDHYVIFYLDSQGAICDVELAHFFKNE